MKPTVLLDCDGILSDFVVATLRELRTLTGRTYEPDAIHTWEVFDSIPDEKKHQDEVYRRLKSVGGCKCIPIMPGAQEGVRRLKEVAHVVIVTSPFTGSETWMHERETWLGKHFEIPPEDIIHTKNKSRVHGDMFIDDSLSHVQKWVEYWRGIEGLRVRGVLWTTPRHPEVREAGIHTVTKWDGVMNLVSHFDWPA